MVEAPGPKPRVWRIWSAIVILDAIACGCMLVFLSWIFVESGTGLAGKEGQVIASIRQSCQDPVLMAGLLGFIKLSICPQY